MANIVREGVLDRDPRKRDFKNFLYSTWMHRFGNPPTELMYDFADWLQHGPNKLFGMGFRGLSKSFITVDYGLFTLHCDPHEIVLTVSGSAGGAKGNAYLAYQTMNNVPWLAYMKPTGSLRQSALAFDVAGSRMEKSESFAAESIFGQLTGRRCSLALPDDTETPNTSSTEADRAELRRRMSELVGACLKPGGRVRGLGTPQTEDTIYLEYARDKGYGLRIWPVTYPTLEEASEYGPWLAPSLSNALLSNPHLAGLPTEPSRFDLAEIEDRKLEYGKTEFERQFRIFFSAGTGEARPLKLRDIPVIEIPVPTESAPLRVPVVCQWGPSPDRAWKDIPVDALSADPMVYAPARLDPADEWARPEGVFLIVDPSGQGRDETAWCVIAQHLGRLYLVKQGARLEGFSQGTLEAIAEDARIYKPHRIIAEKNYGGGMFGELLSPVLMAKGVATSIEELNAGQVAKEQRIIDTLEPIITSHRLVIAAQVLRDDFEDTRYETIEAAKRRFYRLTYQLTRMTKQKGVVPHDDRLDALATGVQAFMGTLRRILEEAARESRAAYIEEQGRLIIEELKRQSKSMVGHNGGPPMDDRRAALGLNSGGLANSPLFPGRVKPKTWPLDGSKG